jgi:membrane-bound inhibitor of C-type lysozyme
MIGLPISGTDPMRACLLLPALLACGCVSGPEMAVLPESLDYRCAEGREMRVQRAPDGREAIATVDGKSVRMRRAESAAQEKYVEGAWTLYLEGEQAMLEAQGTMLRAHCRSTVPLPVMQRSHY